MFYFADRDQISTEMYSSSTSTLAAPSLQQRQFGRSGVGIGSVVMDSVSQGASNQRFSPKSFRYNGRVASVLLPCLVTLVGYGGPLVAGVLIVRTFY